MSAGNVKEACVAKGTMIQPFCVIVCIVVVCLQVAVEGVPNSVSAEMHKFTNRGNSVSFSVYALAYVCHSACMFFVDC